MSVQPGLLDSASALTIDGPTLQAFFNDWAFVTIIRGPWGSGKSYTCIQKMFKAACLQAPNKKGIRRTRWAVVRNSYPELEGATIKTWLEIFPEEEYGPLRRSRPFKHVITVHGEPVNGKPTIVEMEVIFIALEDEGDVKKLLSTEFTGAWVNEGKDIIKPLIDAVFGRTGRFPPKRDGGHTWAGGFIDTNAPPEMHWLPMMMGETPIPDTINDDERMGLVKPDDWHYYNQPGGLLPVKDSKGNVIDFKPNPLAENISNLTDGFDYYMKRKGGKTRSFVMVNFCNELGALMSGKPVWPTFEKLKHVPRTRLVYNPRMPLLVGLDSTGRNPAAVFGQHGMKWSILSELVLKDIAVPAFARALKAQCARIVAVAGLNYQSAAIFFYRDPHQEKGQGDDRNTDQMYLQEGIRLIPAPGGNAISTRTQAVEMLFDHDKIEIDPVECPTLIAACAGGYRFRKMRTPGVEVYEDTPDKRNGYADVADGLQYLVLGGGGGQELVYGNMPKPAPVNVVRQFNPMARGRSNGRRVGLLNR